MLNQKYKKYADRFRNLIQDADDLIKNQIRVNNTNNLLEPIPRYRLDNVKANAWIIKVLNITSLVFSKTSHQSIRITTILDSKDKTDVNKIDNIKGVLIGCLDDLENGFLAGQEFITAGEIFDSILEEAKYLNRNGYKDPAAVLCRVILEDAIKRIGKSENISTEQKASKINDDLKNSGRFSQPQWRQNQVWLDIGNAAAHGEFDKFTQQQVNQLIEGLTLVLATEFRN